MSPYTKYVRYPNTPVRSKKERDEEHLSKMTRRERRELFAQFQVARWIINCGLGFFLTVMLLTSSFMGEVLVDLYPDTYAGLHDAAEIILADPDASDKLPAGYWIDENKTTQRILCLKAWDGSWMTWSWSSSHPWMELDQGTGWFFPVTLALSTLLIGVVLGTVVTKIVPLKHSLLWRFSEFA